MAAGATTEFVLRKNFLDQCLVASNNLRTIDPHDKEEDEDILATARRWIEHAKVVYILGYGFDEQNSKRLGLYALPKGNNKAVMFTNFNNTNTINKRAGRLFSKIFLLSSHRRLRDIPREATSKKASTMYTVHLKMTLRLLKLSPPQEQQFE
jgi:hypothetical protein